MPSMEVDTYGNGQNIAPVAKKPKLDHEVKPPKPHRPRTFVPYRTIGLVSPTDVPFTSLPLGKTTFQVSTSTGRCLQTYDLRRGLNLVFLTKPPTPADITATCAWKDLVLAAWGGARQHAPVGVWAFKRGRQVAELEIPTGLDEPIQRLLIFGTWIIGCCSTRIEVWKTSGYEHYTTILSLALVSETAGATLTGAVCHMPTLLNKILVGKQDGSVEIWNVSVGKLVYTIAEPLKDASPVTALEASPALNIVAIARASGALTIHDIRLDKEILRLNDHAPAGTLATTLSFRTDGFGAGDDGLQDGILATAGPASGDVTFWDLTRGGRVRGVLHNAHLPPASTHGGVAGGLTRIEFLPGQPVLASSGRDNALRTWIFDERLQSTVPRPLHSRAGHAAPVTRLEFLPAAAAGADAGGKWLLSAARDRSLWAWSLRRDGQSAELSQGPVQSRARRIRAGTGRALEGDAAARLEDLKAPEVTCIACCLNRDGGMGASAGGGPVWANVAKGKQDQGSADTPVTGWESVVTGHRGDRVARTWFWGRKKAGRWALETGDGTEVASVAISPCGTFALLGSAGGGIDTFNLQSGMRRQRFPAALTPAQARRLQLRKQEQAASADRDPGKPTWQAGEGRHTAAVTGLVVDNLNQTLVSASLDGTLKFWAFSTARLEHALTLAPRTPITLLRHHRANDLLLLACDDLCLRIVDLATRRPVRELWGSAAPCADARLSPDGRWAVAAGRDAVVRVWDLPSGHCVDAFRTDPAPAALALSPTGEFLATAHAGERGVRVWSNRALFAAGPPTRALAPDDVLPAAAVAAPGIGGEVGAAPLDAAFDEDAASAVDEDAPPSADVAVDQLSIGLTTLSLLPRARWTTLLHLEAVASRNRPVEPPKAPEKAPFFLPALDRSSGSMPQQSTTGAAQTDGQALAVSAAERSRIAVLQRRGGASGSDDTFSALLRATPTDPEPFIAHLKALPPAAADVAIRSLRVAPHPLGPEGDAGAGNELAAFVRAVAARVRQRRDYECVQAWMAVFLRVHGEALAGMEGVEGKDVVSALGEWRDAAREEAARMSELVGYCSGVLGFLRSGR